MGTFAHEYSYTKSLDVWRQQINVETYLEDPDQYECWWKLVFIFFKYYFSKTFDLNPKWQWVPPNPNIKVDIWHPAVGWRCIITPRHLRQLKTREIPLI
jgi:hypothetical protein